MQCLLNLLTYPLKPGVFSHSELTSLFSCDMKVLSFRAVFEFEKVDNLEDYSREAPNSAFFLFHSQ